MALEIVTIQNKITETFGESVSNFRMQRDIFCFDVDSKKAYDLVKFLKEDTELNFHFLTDLAGIHYPDNEKTTTICCHLSITQLDRKHTHPCKNIFRW